MMMMMSVASTATTMIEEERTIAVSSTIRLAGLQFSNGPGGPAGRVPRSASTSVAKALLYISAGTHANLEACCSETARG